MRGKEEDRGSGREDAEGDGVNGREVIERRKMGR